MYVDAAAYSPQFHLPDAPAVPNSGWEHKALSDLRAEPIMRRLAILRRNGLTLAMVVRDFLVLRVAPLQRHSNPMWVLDDRACLQLEQLPPDTLQG